MFYRRIELGDGHVKYEPVMLTVGMVTAMLATAGKRDVPLSSETRREIHRMWDAAEKWTPPVDEQRTDTNHGR